MPQDRLETSDLAQSPYFREVQTKAQGGEVTFPTSLKGIAGTKSIL